MPFVERHQTIGLVFYGPVSTAHHDLIKEITFFGSVRSRRWSNQQNTISAAKKKKLISTANKFHRVRATQIFMNA